MKLKFCCRFPPFFPCLGCIYKPQAAADPLLFFLPAQIQFLPLTTHFFSYNGCPQKPYFCCRSPPPPFSTPHFQATQDLFGAKYCTNSFAGYRRTHMVHLYKSTTHEVQLNELWQSTKYKENVSGDPGFCPPHL